MTRRELHEKISETFEPRLELEEIVNITPASSSFPARMNKRPGEKSPLGAWTVGPGMKWRHLDYDTDEAANAMLLEAMPEPRLVRRIDKKWVLLLRDLSAEDYDRKIAIVDAYAKWKKIT